MNKNKYDSTDDIIRHKNRVMQLLVLFSTTLLNQGITHDESKLFEPEKSALDKYTPLLKESVYGSKEYKDTLNKMSEVLSHHYMCNSHHPEHYEDGINDMTLIDVIE